MTRPAHLDDWLSKWMVVIAVLLLAVAASPSDEPASPDIFYQDVAWSPDGERIAFSALTLDGGYSPDKWSIGVVEADGKRSRIESNALGVSWSPDGEWIAFGSMRSGNWEIYARRVEGGEPVRLTDHEETDRSPAWSPDGDRIAFGSERDGNAEIYVMQRDGSSPRRLTRNPAKDYAPSWSPDGEELVFYREVGDGADQIYVVNVATASERRITDDQNLNTYPSFRPDGRIAFSSKDPETDEHRIVHVAADGSDRAELDLSGSEGGAFFARWSPDGSAVAFIRGAWPSSAVYRAKADGSDEVRIAE